MADDGKTVSGMAAERLRDGVTLFHGDCFEVLSTLDDGSVDAVVTDPPYALGFMSNDWDQPGVAAEFQVWCQRWAAEVLRVAKPGAHMLAFGSPRTFHRLSSGIEDAGWQLRDTVAFLYGQGMPKSLDVAREIDRVGGQTTVLDDMAAALRAARESRGWTVAQADQHFCGGSSAWAFYEGRRSAGGQVRVQPPGPERAERIAQEWPETAGVLAALRREGPPVGTITHARSGGADFGKRPGAQAQPRTVEMLAPATEEAVRWDGWGTALKPAWEPIVVARAPLDGTVAATVLRHRTGALNIDATRIGFRDEADERESKNKNRHADFGTSPGGNKVYGDYSMVERRNYDADGRWPPNVVVDPHTAALLDRQHDGASRFFYTAKAPAHERPQLDDGTGHPTVKPLSLLSWLIRLAVPPGGVVLDPFAGSGTTGEAALIEGASATLIEKEPCGSCPGGCPDYVELIRRRLSKPVQPSLLAAGA